MKTIQVETQGGRIIQIEVADAVPAGSVRRPGGQVASAGKVKETMKQLADVADAVADVCRTVHDQIQIGLGKSKPSELALEFSITLAGETGIPMVTKGTAEGTFKVNAKWKFVKESEDV